MTVDHAITLVFDLVVVAEFLDGLDDPLGALGRRAARRTRSFSASGSASNGSTAPSSSAVPESEV